MTQAPDPRSPVLAATPEATDLDAVSKAWTHIKRVIGDDGKSSDLVDLLRVSNKETAYSSQTPGVRTTLYACWLKQAELETQRSEDHGNNLVSNPEQLTRKLTACVLS